MARKAKMIYLENEQKEKKRKEKVGLGIQIHCAEIASHHPSSEPRPIVCP